MPHTPVLAALGTAMLLVACAPQPTAPPPRPTLPIERPDACGATRLQHLVGQPVTAFDPRSARGPVRVIPPGTAVTMDFLPHRLNIETDRRSRITRVFCG